MTNTELITISETSLPVVTDDGSAFMSFADAVSPRHIVGKLLKFNKGDWIAGESSEIIPNGTRVIVGIDWLLTGWVFWQGSKPVDHRMVYVANGVAPPRRAELGDTDRALWEKDASGELRDPWALTEYLPMVDEQQEVFTFSRSSRGGLNAIADLARHYGRNMKNNLGMFPTASLEVGTYQHTKSQYGRIKFPTFKPTGWELKDTFWRIVGANDLIAGEPKAEPKPDGFSDDIPF
jgi:hypothetical protein